MPTLSRPDADAIPSLDLPAAAHSLAITVASSRDRPVLTYLLGAIRDAALATPGGTTEAVTRLVVARIEADHDRLDPEAEVETIPFEDGVTTRRVALAGPGLARKTKAVARAGGISVREYMAGLYGQVAPADRPSPDVPEVARRLALRIDADFILLPAASS